MDSVDWSYGWLPYKPFGGLNRAMIIGDRLRALREHKKLSQG
jgi:hypothetical protein